MSTLAQKNVGAIATFESQGTDDEIEESSMTTAELELTAKGSQKLFTSTAMKALVYHGPGKKAWEEATRPTIQDPSDAIVRITTSTICGTIFTF